MTRWGITRINKELAEDVRQIRLDNNLPPFKKVAVGIQSTYNISKNIIDQLKESISKKKTLHPKRIFVSPIAYEALMYADELRYIENRWFLLVDGVLFLVKTRQDFLPLETQIEWSTIKQYYKTERKTHSSL